MFIHILIVKENMLTYNILQCDTIKMNNYSRKITLMHSVLQQEYGKSSLNCDCYYHRYAVRSCESKTKKN